MARLSANVADFKIGGQAHGMICTTKTFVETQTLLPNIFGSSPPVEKDRNAATNLAPRTSTPAVAPIDIAIQTSLCHTLNP